MIHVWLLVMATVFNVHAENTNSNETELIKSLNEVKNLQILGNLITIVSKTATGSGADNCSGFDEYLRNHLIKIQSPLKEDEYFTFELNDLISKDEVEGRERKRKGPIRELLIPLLLALKYKSTVVLPLFMMLVTFIAFKGFWAGMSGLVISKVVGLKVLLQYLNKPEEPHDEAEDQDDDTQQDEEEEHEENEKPVVVLLHPHNQRRKISKRYEQPFAIKRYQTLRP